MEEMIIEFFETYGWKLTLIALSGIVLLGVLKQFHIFDKVPKDYRKYIYAGISSALSILAAGLYLHFTSGFVWSTFGVTAVAIYGLNQFAYSLYENTGLRAGLQKIGCAVISLFKRVKTKDGSKNSNSNGNTQTDSKEQDPNHVPLD